MLGLRLFGFMMVDVMLDIFMLAGHIIRTHFCFLRMPHFMLPIPTLMLALGTVDFKRLCQRLKEATNKSVFTLTTKTRQISRQPPPYPHHI